jgi:hypothetical protein
MLAFVWGNHLFILRVGVENQPDKKNSNKKGVQLQFVKMGEWKCRDSIVGIQWINRQVKKKENKDHGNEYHFLNDNIINRFWYCLLPTKK